MRSRVRLAFSLAVVATSAILIASVASAHLALTDPPSRYGGDVLKAPPCGRAGGTRSTNVLTVEPGATITVQWDEYINHPGHYRIAFDDDGDDDFADPPCLSNCDSRTMVIGVAPGDYTDPTVLADGIEDVAGGHYTYDVTLPDIECDNCTLQVIQVMTDKPPYGPSDPDDIYYQCVDLVLTRGAGGDGGVVVMDSGVGADTGTGGGDTGTGGGDTGTGGGGDGSADGSTGDDGGGCSAAGRRDLAPNPLSLALVLGALFTRRRR